MESAGIISCKPLRQCDCNSGDFYETHACWITL